MFTAVVAFLITVTPAQATSVCVAALLPDTIGLPRSLRDEERVTYTIWNKSLFFGKRVVGSIRFDFLDPTANKHLSFLRPIDRWVSFGYVLAPEVWGRGIATEVVRKTLLIFDRDVRPDGYIATVKAHNLASRRVLEKAGFRILYYYEDICFYGRTKDWPELFKRIADTP